MKTGDKILFTKTISSHGGAEVFTGGGSAGTVVRALQQSRYDYDVRVDRTGVVIGVKTTEIRKAGE